MIFEPEFETMPRAQLRALQSERLRALVRYASANVPFYRHALGTVGIGPEGLSSIDDIATLPFTTKEDLRQSYPFGMFAVAMKEVVRIHASSGTTGDPTVVGYTGADIEVFATVCARTLAMGGAEPGMILHNAYGYGLFTGGLGLHYGGEKLGMAVVPVSGGMTERQVKLITDFGPDVISCTPSYALTLAGEFAQRGIEPADISLRYALLGAEPWTESMRAEIEAGLGLTTTNIYGLSEIIGPGVSNECVEAQSGSHVNEDHFYPEIVDPVTKEPLPEGEEGVLVFTTLTKEAMPLIRYWTGDITRLQYEECKCGRTLCRMGLIRGRSDDMLIIRGVNVYPTQVAEILGEFPELTPHHRLIVSREGALDDVEVEAEVASEDHLGGDGAQLQTRVAQAIKGTIGVSMKVALVGPGRGPRSEGGKLARVVDRRKLT